MNNLGKCGCQPYDAKKLLEHKEKECGCATPYNPKNLLPYPEKKEECICKAPYDTKKLLEHKEEKCECKPFYDPKQLLIHKEPICVINKKPTPYVIKITASQPVDLPPLYPSLFILFGNNKYNSAAINYGSYPNISYQVGNGSISYPEFLQQSATEPFKVKKWKIITTNALNLQQSFLMNYQNANGKRYSEALHLYQYGDVYQSTRLQGIADYNAEIDGIFYVSGYVLSGTSITIIVFPESIANLSNSLDDEGDIMEQFDEAETSLFLKYLNQK